MFNDPTVCNLTEWQARVASTGLRIWRGKHVEELTDQECQEVEPYIARRTGTLFY